MLWVIYFSSCNIHYKKHTWNRVKKVSSRALDEENAGKKLKSSHSLGLVLAIGQEIDYQ